MDFKFFFQLGEGPFDVAQSKSFFFSICQNLKKFLGGFNGLWKMLKETKSWNWVMEYPTRNNKRWSTRGGSINHSLYRIGLSTKTWDLNSKIIIRNPKLSFRKLSLEILNYYQKFIYLSISPPIHHTFSPYFTTLFNCPSISSYFLISPNFTILFNFPLFHHTL